jgi:exosortase/archaeosortase family protein
MKRKQKKIVKKALEQNLFFLIKKKFKRDKPIFVFLAKFFAIFAVLEILINIVNLSVLTNLITLIVANFFDLPFTHDTIFVNCTEFMVTNSCTGLVSLAILIAITLPLKGMNLKKRLGIIIAGAVLLLSVNIPRIGLVIYAAMLGYDAEFVHELTWFFMSAVILLVWYYGIKFIEKKKEFSELI